MLTRQKWMVLFVTLFLLTSIGFPFGAEYNWEKAHQWDLNLEEAEQGEKEITQLIVNTAGNLEDGSYQGFIRSLEKEGFQLQSSSRNREAKEKITNRMGFTYVVDFDEGWKNWKEAKNHFQATAKAEEVPVNFVEANRSVVVSQESGRTIHPSQRWHYDMLFLKEAWEIETGRESVKVSVLDTGIDYTHPGVRDRIDRSLGRNLVDDGALQDPMDRNGHGTHVAGIIGGYGVTAGVMEQVTLVPIKVLDDEGKGKNHWIYEGILHAIDIESDVINISFGSTQPSQLIQGALELAEEEGITVVAATGNDGLKGLQYPAAYPTVLSVGSVNPQGIRSVFSNYGEGLDVMAPGEGIYSTVLQGKYEFNSGTSMAAPQISGVVGLVKSMEPDLTPGEIRNLLRDHTTRGEGYNELDYGQGILDSYSALRTLRPHEPTEESENRRISGANRYETAYKIALEKYGDQGADTAILVRGDGPQDRPNVVDGLTASALAGELQAPIFLTAAGSLHPSVLQGIKDLGTEKVILIGGEKALEPSVETFLQLEGVKTKRISLEGGNRYTTAAEVTKKTLSLQQQENRQDLGERTAMITRGDALVDALLAGPIAHKKGYPILLVSDGVPKATESVIREEGIENLVIIGGEAVVSPEVQQSLEDLVEGEVKRIAGDQVYGEDRYGTSLMVFNAYGSEGSRVNFVNGASYVDAVAASILEVPIIYTRKEEISREAQGILGVMETFSFIGGPSVLSEEIYRRALEIISGP
ncbi:S8 family serine peptidase [Isachenkonia alkalipeptolytica]|uniref:Peptidase S8/S53 domain-containing protein n=1 Tax=Isachenkonia alkalipeptolytica TaxID=2565777 RepID=A0AA43XMA5_9CLOT|nr:S8 family serine peptidase [Isachenkonia alkalipeptolytica]NBG88869.1 hypothetical protein [Isachenkonia alkalipeptolytica]